MSGFSTPPKDSDSSSDSASESTRVNDDASSDEATPLKLTPDSEREPKIARWGRRSMVTECVEGGVNDVLTPGRRWDMRLISGRLVSLGVRAYQEDCDIDFSIHLDISSGVVYMCNQESYFLPPQMLRSSDVLSIAYQRRNTDVLQLMKNGLAFATVQVPSLPKEFSPDQVSWRPFVNYEVGALVLTYPMKKSRHA